MGKKLIALLMIAACAVNGASARPRGGTAQPTQPLQCVPQAAPTGTYANANLNSPAPNTLTDATFSASAAMSPDCTLDAAIITEDATSGAGHAVLWAGIGTAPAAGVHTGTIFVAPVSGDRNVEFEMTAGIAGGGSMLVNVNLSSCTIFSMAATGTITAPSSTVRSVSQRGFVGCLITLSGTYAASGPTGIRPDIQLIVGNNFTYNGNGRSAIKAWGLAIT